MFKLLTEEEKEKVEHEYGLRRIAIMLVAFITVLITGIIGLLPSYILSNARQYEVLERTRIVGSAEQEGDETNLQNWLAEFNFKLKTLSPKFDTDRPSSFIEEVLDKKVSGVSIKTFSWVKVKNKVTLSVDGMALDRQALINFENSINTSQDFSEITLPVSNLAQDKNINFQIKLSLASTTQSEKP